MIHSPSDLVVRATRHWLERAVIGLNLCPFARAVHARNQVHYHVSEATSTPALLDELAGQLDDLATMDPSTRETTLLMVPGMLDEFLDFVGFLGDAQRLLKRKGLLGAIQLASFHPRYEFADSDPQDVANCTNRSPYPIIQLLREQSIERAVASVPQPEAIYEANMRTLRSLGREGWDALGVGRPR